MKEGLIGFGVGIALLLALFFLYHQPAVKNAYQRGLNACSEATDTVVIKGDTVYADTTIYVAQAVPTEQIDEDTFTASMDTSVIYGEDKVKVFTTVVHNVKDGIMEFFQQIDYKKAEVIPDTVKITVPKYITTVKEITNWTLTGIAYIAGIFSAIIILLLGG